MAVDNLDMLEDLINYIKNPDVDLTAVVKEYSSMVFYIPSYKTTFRNDDIIKEYQENINNPNIVKKLAKDYNITVRQIYDITKEVRNNL